MRVSGSSELFLYIRNIFNEKVLFVIVIYGVNVSGKLFVFEVF